MTEDSCFFNKTTMALNLHKQLTEERSEDKSILFNPDEIDEAFKIEQKILLCVLLYNGHKIDTTNKNISPYHYAVKYYDSNALEVFCCRQYFLDIKNLEGDTPLHMAFKLEPHPGIRVFLSYFRTGRGISDSRNRHGLTHLHIACSRNYVTNVETQVEVQRADVNKRIGEDAEYFSTYTPLHIAAEYNCKEVANFLLQHEAIPLVQNRFGQTPVHIAINHRFYETADLILNSALHFIKNSILYKDSNLIDTTTKMNLLHISCLRGNIPFVKETTGQPHFLSYANDSLPLETPTWPGYTALHLAVEYGHTKVVELLLEAGADTDVRRKDGWTPLHIAVANENIRIVTQLLKYCTNAVMLNRRCMFMPIHCAIDNQGHEILQLLLDSGHNVDEVTLNEGVLPYCDSDYTDIASSKKLKSDLAMKLLVQFKSNYYRKSGNNFGVYRGMTALHLAVIFSNYLPPEQPKKILILLRHFADVNILDADQRVPAYYCHRHVTTAQILREWAVRRRIIGLPIRKSTLVSRGYPCTEQQMENIVGSSELLERFFAQKINDVTMKEFLLLDDFQVARMIAKHPCTEQETMKKFENDEPGKAFYPWVEYQFAKVRARDRVIKKYTTSICDLGPPFNVLNYSSCQFILRNLNTKEINSLLLALYEDNYPTKT